MGDENTLAGTTKAHKHSATSSDGGFLETTVTGVTNLSQGSLVVGDASEKVTELSGGTSGDVLTANGAGVLPSYQPLPAGGADANFIVSSFYINAYTQNGMRYAGLWQNNFDTDYKMNDGSVSIPLDFAWELNRIEFRNASNTKNGDTIFNFRDDGADIASVTIPSSSSGLFTAGVLAVAVASGSNCNWKINTTASSSGTLSDFITAVAYGKST